MKPCEIKWELLPFDFSEVNKQFASHLVFHRICSELRRWGRKVR